MGFGGVGGEINSLELQLQPATPWDMTYVLASHRIVYCGTLQYGGVDVAVLVKVYAGIRVYRWVGIKRDLRGHRHLASKDVNAGQHHEHHAGLQPGAGKPQCAACGALCLPGGELGRVLEGSIPYCRPRYASEARESLLTPTTAQTYHKATH